MKPYLCCLASFLSMISVAACSSYNNSNDDDKPLYDVYARENTIAIENGYMKGQWGINFEQACNGTINSSIQTASIASEEWLPKRCAGSNQRVKHVRKY